MNRSTPPRAPRASRLANAPFLLPLACAAPGLADSARTPRRVARALVASTLVLAAGAVPGCFCAEMTDALVSGVLGGLTCALAGAIDGLLGDHGRALEERALRGAQLALAYDRTSAATGGDPFPAYSKGCAHLVEEDGSKRLFDLRACGRPWGTALVDDAGAQTFSITLFQAQLAPAVIDLGLPSPDFTGHIDAVEAADGTLSLHVKKLHGADSGDLAAPSTIEALAAAIEPYEAAVEVDAELTATAVDATHFGVSGYALDLSDPYARPPSADAGAQGDTAAGAQEHHTTIDAFTIDTTCIDSCGAGTLHGRFVDASGAETGTYAYERRAAVGTCGHCSTITVTDAADDGADCGPQTATDCSP
jgi:hypothetical protein